MANSEDIVKTALSDLLHKHDIDESLSVIDDIVLNYILSILEELGEDTSTDDVDVDHFVEMISAYLPGFREINNSEVVDWMFDLASKLRDVKSQESSSQEKYRSSSSISNGKCDSTKQKDVNLSSSHPQCKQAGRRRTSSSSEVAARKTLVHHEEDDSMYEDQICRLLELFPDSCAAEVLHCLQLTDGHTDGAAQLVLHRQETDTCLKPLRSAAKHPPQMKIIEDKKLKELLLHRYGFVDTDEDKKTHIPPPLKQDSKKMIRYLGNQVVTTKGERYTELKKPESEEMKKTYVSLKPARKYKFH